MYLFASTIVCTSAISSTRCTDTPARDTSDQCVLSQVFPEPAPLNERRSNIRRCRLGTSNFIAPDHGSRHLMVRIGQRSILKIAGTAVADEDRPVWPLEHEHAARRSSNNTYRVDEFLHVVS